MTATLAGSTGGVRPARALLTDPATLMEPARLAALPPSRLSASRSLVNLMTRRNWMFSTPRFELDEKGRGRAVYRVLADGRTFDFVVLSFEPVLEGRTGRIIGTNWDMMGALIEGEATDHDIDQAAIEIPKLYAGRATPGTLVWCRSNRSLRLFDHVVENLAQGEQPDLDELLDVGYLMRNTGLDGNGTFGTRSFLDIEPGHPLGIPYHAQMLAAYLMREFSFDLVEHLARQVNPHAIPLSPEYKRALGLGNGSGLGLLFFVNTHPALINRWLTLRQEAIAHACEIAITKDSPHAHRITELLQRAARFYREDPFTYRAFEHPDEIATGVEAADVHLAGLLADGEPTSGGRLLEDLDQQISAEAWEVVAAILLEIDAEHADNALLCEAASELLVRDPRMTLTELDALLRSEYAWAIDIDMGAPGARYYTWYKSRDAEEPRRGPAQDVHGGRNWALDLVTDVQAIQSEITTRPGDQTVAVLLAEHPELRSSIERIQGLQGTFYHSPHMNMLDAGFKAVRIIRFMNAAFHGLDRTVDSLDRNVLGLLFQGAPTRHDITNGRHADWIYPRRPDTITTKAGQ